MRGCAMRQRKSTTRTAIEVALALIVGVVILYVVLVYVPLSEWLRAFTRFLSGLS